MVTTRVAGLLGRGVNALLRRRSLLTMRADGGHLVGTRNGRPARATPSPHGAPLPAIAIDMLHTTARRARRTRADISILEAALLQSMCRYGCDPLPGCTCRIKGAEEAATSTAVGLQLSATAMDISHVRMQTVPTPPPAVPLAVEFEGATSCLGLARHEEAMCRLPVLSPHMGLWAQFEGTTMCLGRRGDVGETLWVPSSAPPLGRRPGRGRRESPGTLPTSTSKPRSARGYGTSRRPRRLHNAWLRCANGSWIESAPKEAAAATQATLALGVGSSASSESRSRGPPRLLQRTPRGIRDSHAQTSLKHVT